jgi:glycosyltransferase involved in cell wall biosynthesis
LCAGLHRSAAIADLGPALACAARMPRIPGVMRLVAPLNAALDGWMLRRAGHSIVHPTYYRDPATLPSAAPVVVTVYDLTHERFPRLLPRSGPERWKRALCARAQRVLCLSEATRRDAIEFLGVPEERTRVTPLASREWDIAAQPVADIATPFLLWVGERRGYKNFARTFDAWATSKAAAHTHLLCAGGLPLDAAETASNPGAAHRVRQRTLSDAELRWAYENASGLLYTSLWEGFGMPVLEAFALGCPAVTSDRSSLPEVGGDVAFYADPDDTDALRDAIERMLREGREPERVERARRQNARFSWQDCAGRHEAAYRELD